MTFGMTRFLVDPHRIVITPIPEILSVYITGQVELGLISHDQNIQNPVIMHKVQELSTEIPTEGFILFSQFMGNIYFVWINPQVFMQNSLKGPA
jgi:hypothetical protein